MSIDTFQKLQFYFENLAYSHPVIRDFGMYIDARNNSQQRSENTYPILEMEVPEITFTNYEGGDQQKTYKLRISVLDQAAIDDWSGQDKIMSDMEVVMQELLSKMHSDGIFESVDIPAYPIHNVMHDNLYGWGIQLDYQGPVTFCDTPEIWKDVHRLLPVFQEGQQELKLQVEGEDFATNWLLESDSKRALNALKNAINQAAIPVTAFTSQGCLIITADVPNTSISVIAYEDEHSWTFFNT